MLEIGALLWILLGQPQSSHDIVMDRAVVALIDHAEIPAQVAGSLESLLVREGDVITAGQVLARIDDNDARLVLRRTEMELAAAEYMATDESKVQLKVKAVEKEQKLAAEQTIDLDLSTRESLNDVSVRAAEKAQGVAASQHQRALSSREAYKKSVSDAELDGLRLAMERAALEHEQAQFLFSMMKLKLAGKEAAMLTQGVMIEAAELDVRDAKSTQRLAQMQAGLKRHDVEAANDELKRREVRSPIEGVVFELHRRMGEWVQPGEKVVRIVRLSRLRTEGSLPLAVAGPSLVGRRALVEVTTSEQGTVKREGRVSFVAPDVDPINQEVRVWVEFENPGGVLIPGMRASVLIPGEQAVDSKAGL